tara:strand:- start:620 stop:946 length:327 start_codon:yes stop_codon:yes gene_type:complete
MEIQGKVKEFLKPETFTSKKGVEFTKQTMLVTTGDNYPAHVPIDFFQDKISLLKNISVNQDVTVHFNFKSSEYKGKYYVSIQGWKIDTQSGEKSFEKENTSEYTDLPF